MFQFSEWHDAVGTVKMKSAEPPTVSLAAAEAAVRQRKLHSAALRK